MPNSLIRLRGVAARYVSGWMFEADRDGPVESHAWAEVNIPGVGWVEEEPAHVSAMTESMVVSVELREVSWWCDIEIAVVSPWLRASRCGVLGIANVPIFTTTCVHRLARSRAGIQARHFDVTPLAPGCPPERATLALGERSTG